ncbi:MAG: tripartite tricarboxylate transporter substrate-binding protein [Marinobacter sp.]|uniref:Bug family tripartite tricarboxylate transporter substrate binding protein n=1 Tax=Marinobacter sp. TaxID=50741 RepID=UPI003297D944
MVKTTKKCIGFLFTVMALVAAGGAFSSSALAQDDSAVADFYKGKTVSVVIRSTPGGGYDFYGRLVARHIGKYIPGNPDVIAVNRPGAGGLVATNYMFNRAPKDGTEILIPARELAVSERLGGSEIRYKTLEFGPLGSVSKSTRVWLAGPDVPVNNLEDLKNYRENHGRDFSFAVSGRSAGSYQLALMLEESGYPVKIITGYEGTSDQTLAVLRDEAQGTINTYGSALDQINDEGFKVISKLGSHPDIDNVENVKTALTGKWLQVAEVLEGQMLVGRPFFTAPGVPEDRLKALQDAFYKVVQDPEAAEEAKRAGRPWGDYASPAEMTDAYEKLFAAPDEVVELLGTE